MGGIRILVIEDDEVAAEIVQVFVRHHDPDAELNWCWNGFEALVRVNEFQPDLILLDYMMPRMDGLEFLKTVRRLSPDRRPYVAVISAYVDDDRRREFDEAGADRVLSKPTNMDEIGELLRVCRSA